MRAGSPGKREPKCQPGAGEKRGFPVACTHPGIGKELFGDANHRDGGTREPQVREKCGRDPLVDQNPAVLRVVLKFNYIMVAIRGLQQVRLRTAAHLAQHAAGVKRHWGSLVAGR